MHAASTARCRFAGLRRGAAAGGLLAALLPPLADAACPDLSGRYRVAGIGRAEADLLSALQLSAHATADDLRVESGAGGVLTLQVLAAQQEAGLPRAPRTLFEVTDFECRGNAVLLNAAVPSARQQGNAHLEGRSTVRLARQADGSLAVEVSFSGSERADLYRYDSARVSVPRPFSRRTLNERFVWLPAARVPVPVVAVPAAPAVVARTLREDELRARLTGLLGGARVGFVKAVPGGMRVQLRASRADDVVAAEDRLRAAGLPFEVQREPVWSGNDGYLSEIHLHEARDAAPGRPSAFRVAAELNRLLPATVHAEKVRRLGDAYVAEVVLLQGAEPQALIDSLARRSTLLARVVPLPAEPGPRRVERWLVTLRP